MRRMRFAVSSAAVVAFFLAGPATAGHHSWDFTEIFSNFDGSVQYMEMFVATDGEAGLGPFTITAGANTFNFVTNLPSALTANTWVLIATPAFAALSGAPTPDYVLSASFFATGGGTLNYAGGADTWAYGAVPTDGILALQRNGSTATNSPTNFAGATGTVNASSAVPSASSWALMFLVGAILLIASGTPWQPAKAR